MGYKFDTQNSIIAHKQGTIVEVEQHGCRSCLLCLTEPHCLDKNDTGVVPDSLFNCQPCPVDSTYQWSRAGREGEVGGVVVGGYPLPPQLGHPSGAKRRKIFFTRREAPGKFFGSKKRVSRLDGKGRWGGVVGGTHPHLF